MPKISLHAGSGHALTVLWSFLDGGWKLVAAPADGRLPRNRLLLRLITPGREHKLRVHAYKVTHSSRQRDMERRVEITSTYQGNLRKEPGYQDVVLGYDEENDTYVGIDQMRLEHGGPTTNASSFLDLDGLSWRAPKQLQIRPRPTTLREEGIEYHAYMKPTCLPDYMLNSKTVHSGTFEGPMRYASKRYKARDRYQEIMISTRPGAANEVAFRAPKTTTVPHEVMDRLVGEYEESGRQVMQRKMTPEELAEFNRRCDEIGQLGERYVFDEECRRLQRAGCAELARRVKWIARESVIEGYDILSYETNGEPRFIEVKSTAGHGNAFFISNLEWDTARKCGSRYFIYRVKDARKRPVISHKLRNPVSMEKEARISLTTSGYKAVLHDTT